MAGAARSRTCAFASVEAISADGRLPRVAQRRWAPGAVPSAPATYLVDRTTGERDAARRISPVGKRESASAATATAVLYLANGDLLPNGSGDQIDLYLRDVATGTDRASGSRVSAEEANATASTTRCSRTTATGRASRTDADNLVPDDTNGVSDVFVRPVGVAALVPATAPGQMRWMSAPRAARAPTKSG